VAEIVSDTRTVHSLHKYMRKFRAEKIEEIEKRICILSFFVYYNFCKLFFFSNGVTNGWNILENGQVFSKKKMEFQVA
jgi:hypothetical protein